MNNKGCVILAVIILLPIVLGSYFWYRFTRLDDVVGTEALEALRHDLGVTAYYRLGTALADIDSFTLPAGVNTVQQRFDMGGKMSLYRFNASPEDIVVIVASCSLTETGTVAPYEGDFESKRGMLAFKSAIGDTRDTHIGSPILISDEARKPEWWSDEALLGCEAYYVDFKLGGGGYALLFYNRAARQAYFKYCFG